MGALTGQQMVDELSRRLTNLDEDVALAALNRAQHWVLRQGSFTFMLNPPVSLTITSAAPPSVASTAISSGVWDTGKAKMMFNTDGTPIRHIPLSDFWASLNYNVQSAFQFDTYAYSQTDAGAARTTTFYFLPGISGTAYFHSHKTTSRISLGGYSDLPADFDDLLIDLAEAEERRIYDIGDQWALLMQRSQEQIKLLLDAYRSETQQETQMSDAQVKAQEVSQLGRN